MTIIDFTNRLKVLEARHRPPEGCRHCRHWTHFVLVHLDGEGHELSRSRPDECDHCGRSFGYQRELYLVDDLETAG